MRKSAILMMFGISTFLIVREWYREGNTGIPTPTVLQKPAYAFGILLLASDFLENIAVVFSVAIMFSLAFQAQNQAQQTTQKKTTKKASA